jgi:RNA polymerase sigma factor (sigma-70 family)
MSGQPVVGVELMEQFRETGMESEDLDTRLSRIQTLWTLVRKAHGGPADAVQSAQRQLLNRYGGAIRRYLKGVLRDADAAEDLFQEFAVKLLKGELHGADPERGRFRQFVKGVLFHLVADHHRRRKRSPGMLAEDAPEPAVAAPSLSDLDRDFVTSWREALLATAWQGLEEVERSTGKAFYTVLRFRAEHPQLSSEQMSEQLSAKQGKPLTAAGVRQTLHRARTKFAELVLDEVLHSLETPTPEQVEQELEELGLLDYCRPALEKKKDRS